MIEAMAAASAAVKLGFAVMAAVAELTASASSSEGGDRIRFVAKRGRSIP